MRLYTSDLHLGHVNILSYCNRPYASVDEMHCDIVARWNALVNDDDEVYILGDLAMGKLDESLEVVRELAGAKILVPGNHDGCWKGKSKSAKQRVRYEAVGLRIVDEPDTFELAGRRTKMCHFPSADDSQEYVDRFPKWRPVLRGEWLLHGHVHDRWRQRGREINVGVDAWGGYPVTEGQLEELVRAGERDLEIVAWT